MQFWDLKMLKMVLADCSGIGDAVILRTPVVRNLPLRIHRMLRDTSVAERSGGRNRQHRRLEGYKCSHPIVGRVLPHRRDHHRPCKA
jgi:hypothetical protein